MAVAKAGFLGGGPGKPVGSRRGARGLCRFPVLLPVGASARCPVPVPVPMLVPAGAPGAPARCRCQCRSLCRFSAPAPVGAPEAPVPVQGAGAHGSPGSPDAVRVPVPGARCRSRYPVPVPVPMPGGAPGARRGARARRGAVRYGGAERAPGTLNGRRFIYRPLHRGSWPPDGRRHRAGSGTGLRVSPATRVAGAGSPRDHRAPGPHRGCGDRATGFLPGEESDTRSPQPRGFWG